MMRCIAIDDEPVALIIIDRYCRQRGGIELETYSSPLLGMQRINEWKPDIVFLDIEMHGASGIEMARQIPSSCCLIFTTAYAHYALEGFEVNAVDFLHKPYFYERFNRAMDKAEQWLHMHDLLQMSESDKRQLILNSNYKKVSIAFETVLFIESIDNYVKVHLADGTSILSKIALHVVEGQLPPDEFIRIHRSYIVNRCRIEGFSRSEVIISRNGKALPIGKKYLGAVISALANHRNPE
ncbi:MAG: LytR/AlgR family response regulator transcription factor [Muribaculaceae bacterium]